MADPVVLPRRYRPFGARIAAAVAGTVIVLSMGFLWVMLPAEVQATFTVFERITLIAVFVVMLVMLNGLFRTSALADAGGLTIVNLYKVRHLDWPQIVRVTLSRNRPWALLDLADGSTVSVMAIQSSDGDRATQSARELARVLAARTRTDHDD